MSENTGHTRRGSLKSVQISIENMTCASCAARVEKGLTALRGVQEAAVNFATEKASLTYDGSTIGLAEIIAAVESLGYGVRTAKDTISIGDMTCASCVGRVEKALAELPGVVEAPVNFAAETATVMYFPGVVGPDDLRRAVEGAGYSVRETASGDSAHAGVEASDREAEARRREMGRLRLRFVMALLVGSVLMLLSFFPPSFLSARQLWYVMFVLATPIQLWAGWPFYRAAWAAAKHRATDMNSLVAVGTSAAYLYSAAVTFFPGFFERSLGSGFQAEVYYETAVDDGSLVVDLCLESRPQRTLKEAGEEGNRCRIQISGRSTHSHQGVHICGTMLGRRPGRAVERPPGPQLNWSGEHEHHIPELPRAQEGGGKETQKHENRTYQQSHHKSQP